MKVDETMAEEKKSLARQYWECALQTNDYEQASKLFFKLKENDELDFEICHVHFPILILLSGVQPPFGEEQHHQRDR